MIKIKKCKYLKVFQSIRWIIIVLFVFDFNIIKAVVADAGDNKIICRGNNIQLGGNPVASFGSGNYTFNWTPATDLDDPTDSIPTTSTIVTRTYRLVVTDNITTDTDTSYINITVNNPPEVNAGVDQSICIVSDLLSVSVIGSVSGITNSGLWSTSGDGSFPPGNDRLITSYSLGPEDLINDTIFIVLTSTNNGECLPESDTVLLKIFPKIKVNAGNDTVICSNISVIDLNGIVKGGSTTGTWTTTGMGEFIPGADFPVTGYLPDDSDTISSGINFILTSVNNWGCPNNDDTINIKLNKSAALKLGNDTVIDTRVLNLNPSLTNSRNIKWTTNGDGSFFPSDSVKNVKYKFSTSEILSGDEVYIKLSASSNINCPFVSDSILVSTIVKDIPNAFTPDGDMINDIFMEGEEISVFNRWGQLIYKGKDGWDGTYNDKKVSSGTYFYIIKFFDENNNTGIRKGTVTVIVN